MLILVADPLPSVQTRALNTHASSHEERGLFCSPGHSQSQNSSQVSPTACPAPACASDPDWGGEEGPDHLLKVPRTGCEDCCSQSWPTHCSPSRPSTSPPALSLTHIYRCTHGTQTPGWVVLPGTLRESAAGPAERSYHPTPPERPLSPSGRDDRLINLRLTVCTYFKRTVPSTQPRFRPSQSVHQPWASGGPAADPNLSRVSPTFAPGPRGPGHLAGCP